MDGENLLKTLNLGVYRGMASVSYLPLHTGHVPRWLFNRMVKLGYAISKVIIEDLGKNEFIYRLSNPFWFQALGCALGFDWHSSGITTVLTGVFKEIFRDGNEFGIYIVGGKGREAINIPYYLDNMSETLNTAYINELKYLSRLVARTDNFLLQDGYDLYHQAIIFSEDRYWSIIQQGMNIDIKYARRYHWSNVNRIDSVVQEPHTGIVTQRIENNILNLVDRKSREAKKLILDIIADRRVHRDLDKLYSTLKIGLYQYLSIDKEYTAPSNAKILFMPPKINWSIVRRLYENRPTTIPEFLNVRGVNKEVVRGLALIASLIYGEEVEWRDTIKYTFTVGGKDGVPYPVDVKTYDKLINYLQETVEGADIDREEKRKALQRISRLKLI